MSYPDTYYHLGIDTGGTFTDGVLYDPIAQKVVKTSKVLTTPSHLETCLAQTFEQLVPSKAQLITLVSLSTTLATNAIVEGKHQATALLLLGYDSQLVYRFKFHEGFGTRHLYFVQGRCNLQGEEEVALDEGEVRRIGRELAGKVSAFAVSSYAGPMNVHHEERAAEILHAVSGLPVVQAHHLSSELDSIRRATTASLNASLLSQTQAFIGAVEAMLEQKGVHCPVMMVRGDGSIVRSDFVRHRPVEIIYSGPATSAIGGQALAQVKAAVVLDMGGTTTDLCLVDQGRVEAAESGATVGPYRTCVRTIKARSFGLGGDSLIHFDHHRSLEVGPERVLPISHLCSEFPEMKQNLLAWLKTKNKFFYADDLEVWVLRREPLLPLENPLAQKVVELLRSGPRRMRELVKAVKAVSVVSLGVSELLNQEIIERAGLTPTDLLHITGEYTPWDSEAALKMVEIAAQNWDETPLQWAERVKEWMTRKIIMEIVQFLTHKPLSAADFGMHLDRWLFEESLSGEDAYLGCQISLKVPLVGIGAPAAVFLPAVARRLRAEFLLPSYYEVANAVGTVVGNVVVRESGSVFPCIEGSIIAGSFGRVANHQQKFQKFEQAHAHVRQALLSEVTRRALEAGAKAPTAVCEETLLAPGMVNLFAWAIGKPGE